MFSVRFGGRALRKDECERNLSRLGKSLVLTVSTVYAQIVDFQAMFETARV